MCGRYTIRRLPDLIRLGIVQLPDFEEFSQRVSQLGVFNIAPSQQMPIVRLDETGQTVATTARWGFIPSWSKEKPKVAPINARSETVAVSGMFRAALDRRRCLVPADGFYEWKGVKPPKQPFFIHMKDDHPFAFTGLWERWKNGPDAEPIDTYTILTTSPNEVMKPLHNRMPVILDESDYARWLDRNASGADVVDLLKPHRSECMEAWAVSTRVNTPKNNDPSLVEKVEGIAET